MSGLSYLLRSTQLSLSHLCKKLSFSFLSELGPEFLAEYGSGITGTRSPFFFVIFKPTPPPLFPFSSPFPIEKNNKSAAKHPGIFLSLFPVLPVKFSIEKKQMAAYRNRSLTA